MKTRTLGILLASTFLTFLLLGAGSARLQQDGGCEASCEDRARACIESCSRHDNPMECESQCHEQNEDCVHECRR